MKNTILKAGQYVKYHRTSADLEFFGLEKGSIFLLESHPDLKNVLFVRAGGIKPELVDAEGNLTNFADHFTRYFAPITLPRGNAS